MRKPTLIFVMVMGLLAIGELPETEARMTLTQIRNAMKGMAKSCIGKSGVTPEVLAQTKNGEFPPDKALQCYYMCLFGQIKILKDGFVSLDVVTKQIEMMMPLDLVDRAKEVAQQCHDSANSEDACERSWEFTKCYYETDSSIYFFP